MLNRFSPLPSSRWAKTLRELSGLPLRPVSVRSRFTTQTGTQSTVSSFHQNDVSEHPQSQQTPGSPDRIPTDPFFIEPCGVLPCNLCPAISVPEPPSHTQSVSHHSLVRHFLFTKVNLFALHFSLRDPFFPRWNRIKVEMPHQSTFIHSKSYIL